MPLLLGTTSREFGNSVDDLRSATAKYDGRFSAEALALYGGTGGGRSGDDPIYGANGVQWMADNQFHCPITTVALWHAAAHRATYEYEFDRAIPGQESKGALHSAELPYVFGYYPKTGNIGGVFSDVDMRLADQIETYWTNFARTGDPNNGSSSLGNKVVPNSAGLPHWPALDPTRQNFLRFTLGGSAVVSTTPLRGAQCDLYRKVLDAQLKAAH